MRYDHFTMLPEHAFQPRNGRSGMTLEGGKGSAPPDFGPLADAMRDTGARMEALGNRQLAFGQQRYQETLPLFQQVTAAQLEGQGLAMELARDAVKEKLKYTALEDSLLDEVKKFNERQQSDYFAGQASADVQQALTSQRGSAFRNLSRFGVNPNDRRFADINRGFALSGAAMNAGARNTARNNAMMTGFNLRNAVAGIGRNMPAQALNAVNVGSSSGTGAANVTNAATAPMLAGFSGAMSGLQGNMSAISNTANIMNQGYQNQLAYDNQQNQFWGGVGQIAGMAGGYFTGMQDGGVVGEDGRVSRNYAEQGGKLAGPGGDRTDSIMAINKDSGDPVFVSNNEFIVNAKAAKRYGDEFMHALNKGEVKVVDKRRKKAIRKA